MAIIPKNTSSTVKRVDRRPTTKKRDPDAITTIPTESVQLPDISKWGWDIFYLVLTISFISALMIARGSRGLLTSSTRSVDPGTVSALESIIDAHITRSDPPISCEALNLTSITAGMQAVVSYTLVSQTTPPKTHFSSLAMQNESDRQVLFDVKNVTSALASGSTMALLHYGVLGACENQSRVVSLPKLPDVFTNHVLLDLFPAFAYFNQEVGEIRSSLSLPLELTIHILSVTPHPTKSMHDVHLESQYDMESITGKIQYYFTTTNPLYFGLLYVGLRVGKAVFTRYYRKKHQQLFADSRKENQQGDAPVSCEASSS